MENKKPGINGESFKVTFEESYLPLDNKDKYEATVISAPYIEEKEVFALTSDNFEQTYNTFKGAKIAAGKRKFDNFSIDSTTENVWVYEIKLEKDGIIIKNKN